ncbi:SH3 domain-containing protein [Taibaiella helva]|uniref:SH3 domain-containing protein n=1 Tax=Taibaiella helva TaxID=2301235 RepID=UPI000E57BF1E|nr:SH3 domain-containing protein [Taibaiella helva]
MKTRNRITGIAAFLLLGAIGTLSAQQTMYSTASAGLSLRQGPGDKAKVLTRIPYGTRLTAMNMSDDTLATQQVVLGGLPGYWRKVKYKDTLGYVAEAYLSGIQPPKAGTKNMKSYVAQLSPVAGAALVREEKQENISEGGISVTRQLYKNGMVHSDFSGYEYMAESLQFPGQTVVTVYNLVRGLSDFAPVFKTSPELKEGKYTTKDAQGQEYTWEVRYTHENGLWLDEIKVGWEEGGYSNISIRSTEAEIIVTYSSGV